MEDIRIFKILVVGDNKVVKNALSNNFTYINSQTEYRMSTGVELYKKIVAIDSIDTPKSCTLQIWVLNGRESFSSLRKLYYQGALGFILVFDLTNRDSFKNLISWIYEILKYRKQDTPIVLVGNKLDLDKREVIKNEVDLFRKTFKLEYFETSAKTGEGVDDVFDTLTRLILVNRDG